MHYHSKNWIYVKPKHSKRKPAASISGSSYDTGEDSEKEIAHLSRSSLSKRYGPAIMSTGDDSTSLEDITWNCKNSILSVMNSIVDDVSLVIELNDLRRGLPITIFISIKNDDKIGDVATKALILISNNMSGYNSILEEYIKLEKDDPVHERLTGKYIYNSLKHNELWAKAVKASGLKLDKTGIRKMN